MDEVLNLNNMKPHVRREFGIAGLKIMSDRDDAAAGIVFPRWRVLEIISCLMKLLGCTGRATGDEEEVMGFWLQTVERLAAWKREGHAPKTYRSGLVASQAIISRHIAFGKKAGSGSPKFAWTPAEDKLRFGCT
jgi:hypothetical protein